MRDLSWRPPSEPRRLPVVDKRRWLLVGLVAANVAVIWYHGDPRDLLGLRPAAEGELEQPAAAAPTPAPTPTPAPIRAGVRPQGAGLAGEKAPAPAYDPTLGLRHPGLIQRVAHAELGAGQTAAGCLIGAGVKPDEVGPALDSLTPLVDFRRLRPGDAFKARFDGDGGLRSLDVVQGLLEQARTDLKDGRWAARRLEVPVETVVSKVSGQVETSLWEALVDVAGERPELVHEIVDVFAWEVDFYSQVFPGDTFKVLVEKKYAGNEKVGYGDLLAAELVTGGTKLRAFLHLPEGAGPGGGVYYDKTGRSLRKQLLKAPLKYGHVTSGFGRRRHPVLGYTRAHNGTDYGVPSGTPVWSVGEGRVIKAGWGGGFGKVVEIQHANSWVSQYGHLSRIDVRAGQRVTQKQIVGAVGNTGLSTGPHLHYGLRKNGKYVNPLEQKFDPGKALSGAELAKFQANVAELEAQLDAMELAMAVTP